LKPRHAHLVYSLEIKYFFVLFQPVVNDIVPLKLSATGSQPSQRFPTHLLEAARYAVSTQGEGLHQVGPPSAPLSVDDRKAIYDFVIEV